jgi:tape measure domain-containing protein
MAETVSFVVRLVDQVSAAAGRVRASLGSIGTEAQRMTKRMEAVTVPKMAPVAAPTTVAPGGGGVGGGWLNLLKSNTALGALGRIRVGLSGMTESVKAFGAAQDAAGRTTAGTAFAESLDTMRSSLGQVRAALGTVLGPIGTVVSAFAGMGLAIAKYAAMGVVALGALAAAGAAYLTKIAFEMFALKQNTVLALGALSGGAAGAGDAAWGRILDTAKRLGVTVQKTTEGVQGLMAAGFKGDAAFDWFARIQDLSVIGITGEKVQRLVLAMGQIKAAGVLQGDELRQLQELGLDLGPVWEGIAKRMGITAEQAMKLKGTGKITAEFALGGLQDAIAKLTGAATPGAGRVKYLSENVLGSWDKVKSVASLAMADIAERSKKSFESLKPTLDSIAKWFASSDAEAWSKRLAGVVAMVVTAGRTGFEVLKAFVTGFGSVMGSTMDSMNKDPLAWLRDPVVLANIKQLGSDFGKLTTYLLRFAEGTVNATKSVTEFLASHKALIATVETVSVSLFALSGAGIAVAGAFSGIVPIAAAVAIGLAPIGIAIYAIVTAVQALVANWDGLKARLNTPLGGSALGLALGGIPGAVVGGVVGATRGFADGGPVAETGPATVHAGEYVVPRGGALVMTAAAAGGARGGTTVNAPITMVQQPGESQEALAKRMGDELWRVALGFAG